MAVTSIRIRRRLSGATGAPSALKTAELAYNQMDGLFYIGYGDDGGGNATSIRVFAKDNYVDPAGVYQPADGDLTALAALAATGGMLSRTGANAFAVRTLAGNAGRVTVTNGDGVSGAPTIDLATVSVGTTTTGGSTKFTVDGYGRVTNAGAASLSDLNSPTAAFSMGTQRITNVVDPTSAQDAATKNYVDNLVQGLDPKPSVRAASTVNVTVANPGTSTFDGVVLTANQRLLLKNQTAPAENGIYQFNTSSTALTRVADMDTWLEIPGAYVFVEEGSNNADKAFLFTADQGGTLGTTAISVSSFGAGTGGFTIAGNGLNDAGGGQIDVNVGAGITITSDAVALTGQVLALHTVTTAADKLIYATGAGTFATTDLTSVARTFLAQTTQGGMRTTGLGLGTMATQDASAVAITGGAISGVDIDGGTF